jgi:serine/threonine protein kinase/O-acetyl-ADP-ribose deacetylase (regulator of RNase III)
MTDREGTDASELLHEGTNSEPDALLRELARTDTWLPPPVPIPGMKWGPGERYRIEELVGSGGMGAVYRATDTLLDRTVALKVLKPCPDDNDETTRARALREARLAARVEHERIARVYDVGEHGGALFVAMEFLKGCTLRQWMKSSVPGPLPYKYFRQILAGIAQGLAALHEQGIVHRDLKPENVMITAGLNVKLLDFGLARARDPSPQEVNRMTAEPLALETGASGLGLSGTPGYIAPERYAGSALHPGVDVFALGVITYELVTGLRPFGLGPEENVHERMRHPPTFWGPGWRHVPQLAEVTSQMLAFDPEERFADGAEAWRAIRLMETPRHGPSSSAVGAQATVLWVDDNSAANIREMRDVEHLGLRVITTTSTKRALRYLGDHQFLAVITDMARAEGPLEGYALLDAMRAGGDQTPLFIFSSSGTSEHRQEASRRGGQGCTDDPKELFRLIQELIHRRSEFPLVSPAAGRLVVVEADIATLDVDAIVNLADPSNPPQGGVSRSVHLAAGPGLLGECYWISSCAVGDAHVTSGHNLKARLVIHTVGPTWAGGHLGEERLLEGCYERVLSLAAEHNVRTLAIPCISTGGRGFPARLAAIIAVKTTLRFLSSSRRPKTVQLCALQPDFDILRSLLARSSREILS